MIVQPARSIDGQLLNPYELQSGHEASRAWKGVAETILWRVPRKSVELLD